MRAERWTGSRVCEGDRDLIEHGVHRHRRRIGGAGGWAVGMCGCVDRMSVLDPLSVRGACVVRRRVAHT